MQFTRIQSLDAVQSAEEWDIAVVGGGATGLGTAVDAASRGYKTLLVEKHDFAESTSSKSTKLLHGGVRYLARGDVKLVLSALRERGLVFQNAPHVSSVQRFVIPSYGIFSRLKFLVGLKLYDWMAGRWRIGRSVLLSKKEVLEKLPRIRTKGLKGGIAYFDGQFDDARLAIHLARTATEQGATLLNYAETVRIVKNPDGKTTGFAFVDRETGVEHTVRAKVVVNATGVFVDDILKLDRSAHKNLVRPSQGAHIVVDKRFLGGADALMIPETRDGRVLFGVPWHGKVLLGTTDTPVNSSDIDPRPLEEEIAFILDTASEYLENPPKRADVRSVFAGLRPLAAPADAADTRTKEISRDHKLLRSESGIVTITGGKWTTYRKMGEETVDMAIRTADLPFRPSKTRTLPIHGATQRKIPGHWQVYGTDYDAIMKLMEEDPRLAQKLHPDYDFRLAEVVWACRNEMAAKLSDVLSRRIRFLLLDARASLQAAPLVAETMAKELGKDQDWINRELFDYGLRMANYECCTSP